MFNTKCFQCLTIQSDSTEMENFKLLKYTFIIHLNILLLISFRDFPHEPNYVY